MKPNAQQLNEWLLANAQDAIKTLQEQDLTLRFVEGPENYHQDRPSLAVGAKGVGFSFQLNHQWYADPRQLVAQALDRAPAFQQAFASAREQYGGKKLPMSKKDWVEPLLVRGECWDICNNQPTTTKKEAANQQHHWLTIAHAKGYQDVAQLVGELCERQAFFDRLRKPDEVLALVRGQEALTFNDDLDVYALNADRRCGFTFEFHEGAEGCAVDAVAFYEDPDDGRMYALHDKARALLSAHGIRYETDGFDNLTPTLTAQDLGMDPLVMNAMADMGVTPLELIRFDAQKAESETAFGEDYLASLDGNVFEADAANQVFMR